LPARQFLPEPAYQVIDAGPCGFSKVPTYDIAETAVGLRCGSKPEALRDNLMEFWFVEIYVSFKDLVNDITSSCRRPGGASLSTVLLIGWLSSSWDENLRTAIDLFHYTDGAPIV
jgi:hypothetical protein